MNATHAIEIPLPEGYSANDDDLALIRELFAAIVSNRYADLGRRERITRQLESEGWRVACGLTWFAEARRGEQLERAHGRSRDEALNELCELTLLDSCGGCP